MPRTMTVKKKDSILDAAASVFSRKDFHEVLTDEIAAEAGVGKGTLYRYFRTKDELYFATLLRGFDELAGLFPSPDPASDSPSARLTRIATEVLRVFWKRRPFYMLLHRDEQLLEDRDRQMRARREGLERVVQEAIRDGISRGEFRPIDCRVAANLFLGMVRAALTYHGEADTVPTYARQITETFLRGIAQGAGS